MNERFTGKVGLAQEISIRVYNEEGRVLYGVDNASLGQRLKLDVCGPWCIP